MQEEETALLSIGAVLEWKALRYDLGPPWTREYAEIDIGNYFCSYMVCSHSGYAPQVEEVQAIAEPLNKDTGAGEESEYWYNTIAEAKAACEVHAATGQFPPSVEPEPMEGEHQARGDQRDDQDE